jgi:hypothetical protein
MRQEIGRRRNQIEGKAGELGGSLGESVGGKLAT